MVVSVTRKVNRHFLFLDFNSNTTLASRASDSDRIVTHLQTAYYLNFLRYNEDLAKKNHAHGHTVPRWYADYNTSGLQVTVVDNQTKPIEVVIRTNSEV